MSKEEIRINFRVDAEIKEKYLEYCKNIGTSYSDDLRRYITKCVNESKTLISRLRAVFLFQHPIAPTTPHRLMVECRLVVGILICAAIAVV